VYDVTQYDAGAHVPPVTPLGGERASYARERLVIRVRFQPQTKIFRHRGRGDDARRFAWGPSDTVCRTSAAVAQGAFAPADCTTRWSACRNRRVERSERKVHATLSVSWHVSSGG
jgi:hypothetical protein